MKSLRRLCLIWRRRFAAVLTIVLLPAQVLSQGAVGGTLGEDASVFEGYRYLVFSIDALSAETEVFFGSNEFDAYLLAVGPDEQPLGNDDGSLEGIPLPPLASVLTLGQAGRWVVVATSLHPNSRGAYVLGTSDSSPIERVAAGDLSAGLVERAFGQRSIMSEDERLRLARIENVREISDLAEQLSLPSYRRLLSDELGSARANAAVREGQSAAAIELQTARVAELEAAHKEVQELGESRALVETLIEGRLTAARSSLQSAEQSRVTAATEATGLEALITELREYEVVVEEREALQSELLRTSESNRIGEIQERLVDLSNRSNVLAYALAEKLIDTEIVRRIRFSGFGTVRHSAFAQSTFVGPPVQRVERAIDTARSNTAKLLPDLLPFPPPVASYPAALDRAVFGEVQPQTLGPVVDQLTTLFRDAGYGFGRHKFLGVPNGFAIMTNIEQHDAQGVPLEGQARWSVDVLPIRRLSLWSIAASLFNAPEGYYRVIVVIVTDRSIYRSDPNSAEFALLRNWSSRAEPSFPLALRDEPFSQAHQIYFLVYQFRKTLQSDLAEYVEQPSIPLENHLSHTRFTAYVN